MDVQFVAYWLNGDGTQELLDPDLHLSGAKVTREMGVGRLTGDLPPEMLRLRNHSGRAVVQEWATAIYVLVDGLVFDAFIVADVTDSDTKASVDCVGWMGYLRGLPYRGVVDQNNYPLRSAVTELLGAQNSWSGANIGLGFTASGFLKNLGSPDPDELPDIPPMPVKPRPFTEKQPTAPRRPPHNAGRKQNREYQQALGRYNRDLEAWRKRRDAAQKSDRDYQSKLRERESALKSRDRAYASASYKINWWSTHDVLKELQDTFSEVEVDYRVKHELSSSGRGTHTLQILGNASKRNKRVEFIDGENVMTRPRLTRGGNDQANTVQVLGAGEGSKMIRRESSGAAGGSRGLRRVATVADKSIRSTSRAFTRAQQLREMRRQVWDYDTLTVIDSDLAPVNTFDVGDEVMYKTLDRRGVEIESWVLVTEIEIDVDTNVMSVIVEPAGEVAWKARAL